MPPTHIAGEGKQNAKMAIDKKQYEKNPTGPGSLLGMPDMSVCWVGLQRTVISNGSH